MGSPKNLSGAQLQSLQALTTDKPEVNRTVHVGRGGSLKWKVPMRSNDIAMVTLEPAAR